MTERATGPGRVAIRMKWGLLFGVVATWMAWTGSNVAWAEMEPPEPLFQKAAEALARGEYVTAIDRLEALADRGFVHPDASYDRGIAYVMRVRAKAERSGDLGRAAAAFEETLLLRPGDADADAALDLVRAEVARRRSRRAKDVIDVRPTLDRVFIGLASEQTWTIASLCASVLFTIGLFLRRITRGSAHVVGSVLSPTAFVALLVLVPFALGARHFRLTKRHAVVVASEVQLTDDNGKAQGDVIPEAARVEVGDRRDGLVHVRWGSGEGWVPSGTVRLLAH